MRKQILPLRHWSRLESDFELRMKLQPLQTNEQCLFFSETQAFIFLGVAFKTEGLQLMLTPRYPPATWPPRGSSPRREKSFPFTL